ncbi:MAG: hypothetical protein AB1700_01840 [Bacillota bacterium]
MDEGLPGGEVLVRKCKVFLDKAEAIAHDLGHEPWWEPIVAQD